MDSKEAVGLYIALIFSAICIAKLYYQAAPNDHQNYIKKYWFRPALKCIPKEEVLGLENNHLLKTIKELEHNKMGEKNQNNVKNIEALERILNCNCSLNRYYQCKDTESACGKMKHGYKSPGLSKYFTKQRMSDQLRLIRSDKSSHRSNVTYEFHFTETVRLACSKLSTFDFFVIIFLLLIVIGRRIHFDDELVSNSSPGLCYSALLKSNIPFLDCNMDYTFTTSLVKMHSHGLHNLELAKDCKHNGIENSLSLGWLLKPLNLVQNIPEYFVYPAFDMSRLASFQPITLVESHVPFIKLADAGFSYTGTGNAIICEDCKNSFNLQEIRTDPASSKYHHRGCRFVRTESSFASDAIGVTAESSSLDSSSLGNVSSEDMVQPLLGNDFSNFSSLSGATNFPEGDTSATCCSNFCFDDELFECQWSKIENEICTESLEHGGFVKFDNFSIEHLPVKLKHRDVLKFFQLCAQLIVKVTSSNLSRFRPHQKRCPVKEGLPGICGTGSLFGTDGEITKFKDLPQALKNGYPDLSDESEIGLIYVETNPHIVFNDQEAKDSTVKLSLSLTNGVHVELKGGHLHCSQDPKGCKISFVYSTKDLQLVKTLNKIRQELFELSEKLQKKFKEYMSKTVVIISHPYGMEKCLSFGDSVSVKYGIETDTSGRTKLFKIDNHKKVPADISKVKKALQYTAVTCPGTSGAPVICFKRNGHNDLKLDIWMHNGVERDSSLGVSVLQACYSEDVLRKIPEPTRPAAPQPTENISRPATVNLPTRNPNSRALSHPSYPVYISYQKRLESFVAWPAGHIHDPHDLARAGFFYAGYADCVRCYQCGLGLKSWKPGDDINVEHERLRPSCPFLQTQLSTGLSSMMDEPSHQRPQLHSETTSGQSSYGSDDNAPLKPQMLVVPTTAEDQQSPSQPSTDVQQPMDSQTQAPEGNNVRVTPGAANGEEYGGASSLGNDLTESHGSGNTNETEERSTIQSDQRISQKHLLESSNASHSSSGVDLPSQNKSDSNHDSHNSESVKDITVSLLEREKKLLQHQVNCKICLVAPIKDLFLPCGHLYACVDCSKSLTHCPACSQLILATVTTYFT
ncbi:unnamed protein product [Lymnaea stagnalis]|uniref:RING-type domain-containing protein n=1 Tax=Lymnaea stagnalis TaxID=6523 RepID=A0AAV2IBW4_LYMST